MTRETLGRDSNPDPITGAPGSHPVGVGVGGVAGAVAAGAVAGTMFGPIGTLVGAAAGAIAGAAAGKGVAERLDPTAEVEYWRENAASRPYYEADRDFDRDYAGAYRTGVEAREQNPDLSWDQTEQRLQKDWDDRRGDSGLDWENARPAVRDSWERADRTYSTYSGTDEFFGARFKDSAYAQDGETFDDYRPAYRYGTYARQQYADRDWDEDLSGDLEAGWERFKGTSRLGWERAKHAVADAFTLDRQRPH